jgi:hypothetical protein
MRRPAGAGAVARLKTEKRRRQQNKKRRGDEATGRRQPGQWEQLDWRPAAGSSVVHANSRMMISVSDMNRVSVRISGVG